jgi:hypothetical protein
MEPVSTEAEEELLLYNGLGERCKKDFPLSSGVCGTVNISFTFVTCIFLPFSKVVGVFGGIFSSKFIGRVFDFFIGSIGLHGGAFGGFLGVASKMGGDIGPLEFGDSIPFVLGENGPFVGENTPLVEDVPLLPLCSGICSFSSDRTLMGVVRVLLACGMFSKL